ncbi:hypothetical protein NDU88_010842 [Pleurodeles waltl]|uniref:Uncharacterized protein n=1 Tax=Pleurodeles waltl TaxID=8319 RepID=A0AAV7S564_PLEWA|nr:hypothetical protein NDU88_010842 [Pleurodeles waltl]
MSPGQPGKFAQACFVGRASGDKERWKHGAAQGGEAAVQRVVRGSGLAYHSALVLTPARDTGAPPPTHFIPFPGFTVTLTWGACDGLT